METTQLKKVDAKKAIASETAKLKELHSPEDQALLGSSWYACAGCKAGLTTAVAGAIAAAILLAPEALAGSAVVATIATATGLTAATVTGILGSVGAGGATAVEEVIGELCKAMGACS